MPMYSDQIEIQDELGSQSQDSKTIYTKRVPWTAAEDVELNAIVSEYEERPRQWKEISKRMTGRTGKQCRERYHNHLRQGIKKGDWSPVEDDLVWTMAAHLNHKWSSISKSVLPWRSDSAIKNRWHFIKRRKRSQQKKYDDVPMNTDSIIAAKTLPDISGSDWSETAASGNASKDPIITKDEEQEWLDVLLGPCSNDLCQAPEGNNASSLANSQPTVKEEVTQLGCPTLKLSMTLNIACLNSSPNSSKRGSHKASSRLGMGLLSPIPQRSSPIIPAKKHCKNSTPRLSSQVYMM